MAHPRTLPCYEAVKGHMARHGVMWTGSKGQYQSTDVAAAVEEDDAAAAAAAAFTPVALW